MPFTTDLDLRAVPGGTWTLLEPLTYNHSKGRIRVPKWFNTDLASVPKFARPLVTGMETTRKPAVVHDYLYRKGIGTKREADAIFLEALLEQGTPRVKACAIYWAVRLFGRSSWKGV